jgi:hypothetical protein
MGMLLQIQLPRIGKGAPRGCGSDASPSPHSDGRDVAIGTIGKGRQRFVLEASPHFHLPAPIPVLQAGLESRFLHWGKDRHDIQAEAEPHHATDTVAVLANSTTIRDFKARVTASILSKAL